MKGPGLKKSNLYKIWLVILNMGSDDAYGREDWREEARKKAERMLNPLYGSYIHLLNIELEIVRSAGVLRSAEVSKMGTDFRMSSAATERFQF